MAFTSSRTFRLWDDNISHKQVLLRSPRSAGHATNLDIVCRDVDYLDVATSLEGLTIATPSAEDISRANQATLTVCEPHRVFSVISGHRRFVIVASSDCILENKLDFLESSLEYFAADDRDRDLGLILADSSSS